MKEKIKAFFLHALRLAAALFVIGTVGSGAAVAIGMLSRYIWGLLVYGFNYFG